MAGRPWPRARSEIIAQVLPRRAPLARRKPEVILVVLQGLATKPAGMRRAQKMPVYLRASPYLQTPLLATLTPAEAASQSLP